MVCNSLLRNAVNIQAANIGTLAKGSLWFGSATRVLHEFWGSSHPWNCNFRTFRAGVKMMNDGGSTGNRVIVNALTENEHHGGYATGGCKSEDGKLSCGYSSFRGKRASMEDFYDVKMAKVNEKIVCLFGIFDGHGGSRAAEYLKQNLFENLMKHPQFLMDTKLAISETYKQTDKDFLNAEKDTFRDDGSTASTAILVGDHLYVANVGDSRAVVSKAGRAIPLSEDHKPNRQDERKRIENAGGVVMWAGTWRVGGVLAMSRAFGNRMLKQYVVAEPEIQEQKINDELELLVLASDGLWDVIANEDALSIARAEEEPEAAAKKLTETAFTRGSADNITCIVVKFNHDKENSVGPNSEQHEDAAAQQDQSKEAQQDQIKEARQDQCNVTTLNRDSQSLHNQSNEPEVLQEEHKDPEILQECKEPEILQDMLKDETPIDQTTDTKLQRRLEGPPANFSGAETLASV